MRRYTVSAKYRAVLEAAINAAVDRIRLDEYRRAHGHKPIVPSFGLRRKGVKNVITIVVVDEKRAEAI